MKNNNVKKIINRKKFLNLFHMTAAQYCRHMGPQLSIIDDYKLFQKQMRKCFQHMSEHYSTAETAGIMNFWLNKNYITHRMMEHCVDCAFYKKFAYKFSHLKSIKSTDQHGNVCRRTVFPTYL